MLFMGYSLLSMANKENGNNEREHTYLDNLSLQERQEIAKTGVISDK